MKRIIRIIFIASVLVLAAVSAAAETYTVKKGDSLFKIGKRYGLTWQRLHQANQDKVKNQRLIFPGQVLIIPEIAKTAEDYTPVKSLGRRPFGKKRDTNKAIKIFSLSEEVKQFFIAKVKKGEFEWAALKKGDKREQMVFGNYRVQNKVIMDFAEGHLEAVRRYSVEWQGEIFHLEIPLKCDNPSWWSEKIPPPPPPPAEEIPPPPLPVVEPEKPKPLLLLMIPPPEEEHVVQPIEQAEAEMGQFVKSDWDMIAGGGNYANSHSGQDARGYYGWIKGRYRPLHFELADNLDLNLGVFGFAAGGQGHVHDYKYRWNEYVFGPSAQLVGKGWDVDFDSGIGRLYNSGGVNLYEGRQKDNIFLGSAHLNWYKRRLEGKMLFPKFELNLEYRDPFSADHEHLWNGQSLSPDPYNNKVLDLNWTQFIYDFKLGKNFRLSPAFKLGAGREWGLGKNYYQLGPAFVLGHKGDDLAYISLMNYKEMLGSDGDQWHPMSFSLDIGKIFTKISQYLKEKKEAK